MTTFAKMISRFDPVSHQPLAEAERHYTAVHFPFAQQLLAGMPQVRTYHINRVVRQLDLAGGWAQRPQAWRFVVLTFYPERSLEFDEATTDRIARDHLNFLRRLRSTVVTETVPVRRLAGQTALTKYLIEIDRPPGTGATSDDRFAALEAVIAEEAARAFGVRLVRCNRVVAELAAEPLEEEGQRSTDRPLPNTDKIGYVEIYADDTRWGDALFAAPRVLAALRDGALRCYAYAVEERCGLDRCGFEDRQ
jgi:hypothetical protein